MFHGNYFISTSTPGNHYNMIEARMPPRSANFSIACNGWGRSRSSHRGSDVPMGMGQPMWQPAPSPFGPPARGGGENRGVAAPLAKRLLTSARSE